VKLVVDIGQEKNEVQEMNNTLLSFATGGLFAFIVFGIGILVYSTCCSGDDLGWAILGISIAGTFLITTIVSDYRFNKKTKETLK
jgi:hypothetical protein